MFHKFSKSEMLIDKCDKSGKFFAILSVNNL
jgi:hypothetical protein